MPWLPTCSFATPSGQPRIFRRGESRQVGFGIGVQRAVLSLQVVPYREVDYAAAGQVLVGMKFFVITNLAVFGKYKRIWSSHDFTLSGIAPLDSRKRGLL